MYKYSSLVIIHFKEYSITGRDLIPKKTSSKPSLNLDEDSDYDVKFDYF